MKNITMDFETYENELQGIKDESFNRGTDEGLCIALEVIRCLQRGEMEWFDEFGPEAFKNNYLRKLIVEINKIIRPESKMKIEGV